MEVKEVSAADAKRFWNNIKALFAMLKRKKMTAWMDAVQSLIDDNNVLMKRVRELEKELKWFADEEAAGRLIHKGEDDELSDDTSGDTKEAGPVDEISNEAQEA